MAPPIRHCSSTPRRKASSSSDPVTRRSSASANSAGATGAVGWITVGRWVSQKSNTLAPAAFRKAALSASTRSPRPMTVACRRSENSASDCSASSTGPVRQPASATAKKFNSARLASCRIASGTSSQRASTTKRARFCVMPGLCSMAIGPGFYEAGVANARACQPDDRRRGASRRGLTCRL
jgi:hypothetical protein